MTPSVSHIQELAHSSDHDYRVGSPHIKHPTLYDPLVERIRRELGHVEANGLPLSVLEVGAGAGSFVELLLAAGCEVTATEMSRASIEVLEEKFGRNAAFSAFWDPDGSMAVLGEQRFAIILYASVLHHIPDYLAALENAIGHRLLPGGSIVTIQDPLWYPCVPQLVRKLDTAMYFSWRLAQGNLRRGISARLRRSRNDFREDDPSDIVEYHVVRNGVDQRAIQTLLAPRFERVSISAYWSSQARIWQKTGERLGMVNTFAVWAQTFQP